jgi:serine/threonine protein kinase
MKRRYSKARAITASCRIAMLRGALAGARTLSGRTSEVSDSATLAGMFVCPECGASQAAPGPCANDGVQLQHIGEDLLLGRTIGAYRVARLLGIGGMGRVYKGVHPTIGSRVAIKVLSRECSDRRDLVERFFSEAKAVNLIRHESIVNVLDLATLPDGRPYIVMEYLDGGPLAAAIDKAIHHGPLPLGGIARLAAEVLDALGAAHAKGIVHRDLKPDNIFVTPAGRAKVLDFGIAKLQPELGGSATHTGSLLGTPHYMSPEQASGRPVDLRADIYAMGVILFECATLQKPFAASSLFDLLRMHVEAPPPSPRAMRPDMPEALEHVIYTALAKHPDQRFASAGAMSVALQQATSQLAPEQWAVVTAGNARAPSGGAWSPTPPASWAQRHAPSTATAGQVASHATRAPASRKGLWIGVAALLLVGGGVTAAVIASQGGSKNATTAGSDGSAGSAGSDVARTAETPDDNAASDQEVAEVPDVPEPAPPGPAPTLEATPPEVDTANIDQQIQAVIGEMDADTLAAMPKLQAALKKYGSFAKIPKRERTKLLAEITGAATQQLGQMGDINNALAGGGIAAVPVPAPANAASASWPPDRTLTPSSWDPKHVKVDAAIASAIAEARRTVPDAALVRIDVDNVFADGHADLTLTSGSYDLRFYSPAHAKRDPSIPKGVPQKLSCAFRVTGETDGVAMGEDITGTCREMPVPKPKCSVTQVWKKVLATRKDLAGAVASITYMSNIATHKIVWMIEVKDPDVPYSEQFPDDC